MSTHTVHEGSGVSRLFTVCLGNLNLPQQHFTNGLIERYLRQWVIEETLCKHQSSTQLVMSEERRVTTTCIAVLSACSSVAIRGGFRNRTRKCKYRVSAAEHRVEGQGALDSNCSSSFEFEE